MIKAEVKSSGILQSIPIPVSDIHLSYIHNGQMPSFK